LGRSNAIAPYLLMLLGDESGRCQILDPAEQYKLIKLCDSYDQAQFWLLEDEYEPIKGRLNDRIISIGHSQNCC
jgi:hypothetical protein